MLTIPLDNDENGVVVSHDVHLDPSRAAKLLPEIIMSFSISTKSLRVPFVLHYYQYLDGKPFNFRHSNRRVVMSYGMIKLYFSNHY